MQDGMQPVGLALIVCDATHIDPATGKRTLLGTFSALFGSQFPVILPSMSVYAAITECRRRFPITIRVIDVNEDRDAVATVEGEVDLADPLAVLEVDFRLEGLVFPEPGEYRVQLIAGGTIIIERRLVVALPPQLASSTEEQTDD